MAFRGSAAVAAGLTTWTVLQGSTFQRLFPDTYIKAPTNGSPDLKLRSLAAYRYVEGKGVLSAIPRPRFSARPAALGMPRPR